MSLYSNPEFARNYESKKFGGNFGQFLKEFEIDVFNHYIKNGDSVLDIGCGSGKLLDMFNPEQFIVGLDLSIEMIKAAKDQIKDQCVNFVVSDAHHLPFRCRSFSGITSSRNLMHLGCPEKAIIEYCRCTSNTIVLDFPHKYSFSTLHMFFRKFAKLFNHNSETYRTYSLKEINHFFSNSAFTLDKFTKYFFIPLFVHRLINKPQITLKVESIFHRFGFFRFFSTFCVAKFVSAE